jgi:hypothetical protein
VVFVFVCWKVASVTGTITEWVMGNQKNERLTPVVASVAREEKDDEVNVEMIELQDENDEDSLPVLVNSVRQLSFREKKKLRVMVIYWEDLQVRIVIIVISLWLLNLVRSPSLLINSRYIHNIEHYKLLRIIVDNQIDSL